MTATNSTDQNYIPAQLVEISRQIGEASERFFILGDLKGSKTFLDNLTEQLKIQNWPMEENKELHKFITDSQRWMRGSSRHVKNTLIPYMYEFDSKELRPFLFEEKNLSVFETALGAAIDKTKETYGDPHQVKRNKRNLLKAAFNAVKDRILHSDAPERKLSLALKELNGTMNQYALRNVPAIEFQGRIDDALESKGWKLSHKHDQYKTLSSQFWNSAKSSERATSIFMRWEMQDATTPPRKSLREAKDFILTHIDDIKEAAKNVATELDQELASTNGLITRYCTINGREQFTDHSKRRVTVYSFEEFMNRH